MARRGSVKSINDISLPPNLLSDMSVQMLTTLNRQDEGTFYEFFQELQLDDVKGARTDCERVQEENRRLALENTDKEPQFQQSKEELRRLVTEAQDLWDDYQKAYDELKRMQNRTELATLRKQLQEATRASENTSEDFASEFVNGKSSLSVDEFIENLVTQRSEYWLRKVKLEKFDELSKNRHPVPTPRKRVSNPPQPTPVSPVHSLPTAYPKRSSDKPTSSLPPNPGTISMPFPAAAYPGYTAPGQTVYRPPTQPGYTPPGQTVYRPPTQGGYPPPGTNYYQPGYSPARPQVPPPRPAPYNQYRQHRY